jgi:hypothetical protein
MHALPTAIPIAKQQKKIIFYILYYYLLIIISKDMERQSNRVSEQQRCAPCPLQDEAPLHSCSMPPVGRGPSALLLHASIWTRPFLHYCSMPPFGRGPSALQLLALYRTKPPLQELSCSRSRLLQNQQLYMLKRHCN